VNRFPDNFDDILFRNRNKDYGAYVLRKKYRFGVIISVCVSVSVFVLIFLIPYIIINQPEPVLKESSFLTEYINSPPPDMAQPDELLPELKKLQKKAAYTVPIVVANLDDQTLSELNADTQKSDTTLNGTNIDGSSHGVLEGSGSDDNAIYTVVQESPEFPGGDQARKTFLQRNIRYPKLAINNKIQGIVHVSFIVEKNGVLTNVKITQGVGAGCDEEALRVIRLMPRWKPGKQQGHEVRVVIDLPIAFILQSKS
jgi:periplasmic protein TonB